MGSSANIICPHCQTKGNVTLKEVKIKKGFSPGKVAGGLVTGGVSLLATGLAKKGKAQEATCGNCTSSWMIG